jgi:hypothetical protein
MSEGPAASWLINFLAAWSRTLGADWKTAADVMSAIKMQNGYPQGELYRAAKELPGASRMTKLKFARFLGRLELVDVGGYRLRREYDVGRKTWLFAVDRTATRRAKPPKPPRVAKPPKIDDEFYRREIPTGPKAPPVVRAGKEVLSTEQVPQDHEAVAALVKAAERQRWLSPGGRENGLTERMRKYADEEAARAARLESDPYRQEVVSGPWPTAEEAATAAVWLKQSGLGADSCTFERDFKHYARTIGAPEPARTADAVRRIRRDRTVRVGLHSTAPTPDELRQRAACAVQAARQERQLEDRGRAVRRPIKF